MTSSEEIRSKQNNEKFLKVQFAAREHFNSAEKWNHFAWLFCLISAFSIFLTESVPRIITQAIPFIADIAAFILVLVVNARVKTAADLRRYFDAYVLNISPNQFSKTELRNLNEYAEKIVTRNPDKARTQISNTGKDSPPGVREWYVFTKPCNGTASQFECQCQNTWWNSKMLHLRLAVTICMLVTFSIVYVVLLQGGSDAILTLLCSAGIFARMVERLIINGEYIYLSNLIEGAQQSVETNLSAKGIKHLQSLIDKRRTITVLELNWFHKKKAKKYSKLYEDSIS